MAAYRAGLSLSALIFAQTGSDTRGINEKKLREKRKRVTYVIRNGRFCGRKKVSSCAPSRSRKKRYRR